jgi:acetolactate synthase-1/2/3 large subunit
VHALPIWEGLRASMLRSLWMRTELCAGFAADGYARVSGRAAPLILSTGPGALNSLAALMEAASAYVPIVAISSQAPRELIGRGRGYLHELADQAASFAPVVKWTARATDAGEIPAVLAEAWRRALSPPAGPTYVEIPLDLLQAPTDKGVGELAAAPEPAPLPDDAALAAAAELMGAARRPVVWAGGGVLRAGAWDELVALGERLDAPIATTYMGKGAVPAEHPLAAGCGCDEAAFRELLERADLVLCVGTELGAETTGQYALRFSGRVVQVDAAPERIGATYPALGLVGDARLVLRALLGRIGARPRAPDGPARAAEVRARVTRGLAAQEHGLERSLLRAIEDALPPAGVHAFDMTILGYWAAAHLRAPAPRRFLYPLGSGTLGYAWPAALGARAALGDEAPALAVMGDGGVLYALAELASARQHGLAATLLVVDDGSYAILREYQRHERWTPFAVELEGPDFVAAGRAFGVAARETTPERLGADLAAALRAGEPSLLVLRAEPAMWDPTP